MSNETAEDDTPEVYIHLMTSDAVANYCTQTTDETCPTILLAGYVIVESESLLTVTILQLEYISIDTVKKCAKKI